MVPVFGGPFSGSRHRQSENRTFACVVLSTKKAIGFCRMRWNGGLIAENLLFDEAGRARNFAGPGVFEPDHGCNER
jgi:hypothetical protein